MYYNCVTCGLCGWLIVRFQYCGSHWLTKTCFWSGTRCEFGDVVWNTERQRSHDTASERQRQGAVNDPQWLTWSVRWRHWSVLVKWPAAGTGYHEVCWPASSCTTRTDDTAVEQNTGSAFFFFVWVFCGLFYSLTLWRPLLPHGYSYKASCVRPG